MGKYKSIISISIQNFRKWSYDYRIWLMGALLLVFIKSYTDGLSDICQYTGVKVSPWLFPFLYMQYYTKMLFFFPLILIYCDAPFIDNNQMFVIIRSGRTKWIIGQLIYIILVSVVYFIFIIAFSIILNIHIMDFTDEWGKILNTIAKTNAGEQFSIQLNVDSNVINHLTPFKAMFITFANSCLSGIMLGLVIFFVNMISKYAGIGTFISSIMVIFSAFASKQIYYLKFSPVAWSTLNYIDYSKSGYFPNMKYVYTIYSVIISLLIVLIFYFSKKISINKNIKI